MSATLVPVQAHVPGLEVSGESDDERVRVRRQRLADLRAATGRLAVILLVLTVVGAILWVMTLSAAQRSAVAQASAAEVAIAAAPEPAAYASSAEPDSAKGGKARDAVATTRQVSTQWVEQVSARTGIPVRAMVAYGNAQLRLDETTPGCGISWNTLAAIGTIESANATHNGTVLLASGRTDRPIRGPVLDGDGVGAVRDTDDGRWDGNKTWDRALGPMQFIPSTWRRWASDGNGDGVSDPDQIDDATLAAARYLCASGRMNTSQGWLAGIYAYNHSSAYVQRVADTANTYAAEAS